MRDAAGDHLVVVGTASKSYCMTGWRIGWIIGPEGARRRRDRAHLAPVAGPATFAQVAAVQALSGPQDVVRRMLAEYLRRRDFIQASGRRDPAVSSARCRTAPSTCSPNVSRCLSRALPDTLELGRSCSRRRPSPSFPARASGAGLLPALVRDGLRGPAGRRVEARGLLRGARPGPARSEVIGAGFTPGAPVLVYLHSPREKVVGSPAVDPARGDRHPRHRATAFEDYLRQERPGDETGLGLVTLFYPISRVERMELDETVGRPRGHRRPLPARDRAVDPGRRRSRCPKRQ